MVFKDENLGVGGPAFLSGGSKGKFVFLPFPASKGHGVPCLWPSSKPVTLYLSDPASILADTAGKASQLLRTPAIRLAPPE